MRHLSLISSMVLALGAGLQGTAVSAQTPTAATPPPQEASPPMILPNGLTSTSTTTQLSDGLSGSLITTTIANPPIPDSPASRRINGGPDSASGRATLAQPGMATTGHPATKSRRSRRSPASSPPTPVPMPMTMMTTTGDPPR